MRVKAAGVLRLPDSARALHCELRTPRGVAGDSDRGRSVSFRMFFRGHIVSHQSYASVKLPRVFVEAMDRVALFGNPPRVPHTVRLTQRPRRYLPVAVTQRLLWREPLHMAVTEEIIPATYVQRQRSGVIRIMA